MAEQLQSAAVRHRREFVPAALLSVAAALSLAACTSVSSGQLPRSSAEAPGTPQPTITVTAPPETPPSLQRSESPEPTLAFSASPTEPSKTSPPAVRAYTPSGLAGCKPYFDLDVYRDHQYEVCTAYVSNAASIALQGFYKYGNHEFGYVAAPVRHHFETRYYGAPRTDIETLVDSWPKISALGGNKVKQDIQILSVSSSLRADRGLLQARERWQVTDPDGMTRYLEPLHTRDVTMCRGRLPGHPLHEWVVVSFSRQPDFDCIGFDQANGLIP